MKRITAAEPQSAHKLRLDYDSGESVKVDFTEVIARRGLFERLGDEEYFRRVTVSGDGRYVEWPGGLDFCADALYERAHSSV